MKASAFAYARATSVADALELLTAHGEKARVLSGGQSLLPAMNLRLISPELIIDIGELAELRGVTVKGGVLTIGALTRHVDLLKSPEIAGHAPLLMEAVAHVAHPAIRNRGTIGGSLPQELLIAVEVPVNPEKSAYFFHEFARRHGDYAIVGLAAQAVVKDGRFADLRLGFFAVGDRPLLASSAGKLVNVAMTPGVLFETCSALDQELDPLEDHQATPAMRRHLAKVLLARCVSSLLDRSDLHAGVSA
jgi:carbon-monoxide dehydrogenase medium subunit